MPDPLDRIREAKDEAEALRLALEEVRETTFEPNTTLTRVKRRVMEILLAVRQRDKASAS